MDDKTAPIPSLKEFKEQQKERKAQSDRSRSMQTKKQMKHSAEKQKTEKRSEGSTPSPTRRPVTEKDSRTSGTRYQKKLAENNSRAADDMGRTRAFPAAKGSRYADSESAAQPQKRTYARDRIRQESESVRTDKPRTAPPVAQSNSRRTAPQRNPQRNPQRDLRNTSHDNTQSTQKKPKKPLSPRARKFRSFIAYASILLVVLIVGVVLSLTVLFKTESINVSGNGQYSVQEIIDASGLHLGENIFTAPKGWAADKIEKAYPFIEEADIYSVFPNAINIDITMAKPACVIEALGGYYVLSDQGKVLEVASTTDEIDAPVIEGLEIEGRVAGEYVEYGSDVISAALEEMFTAFSELGAENITAINIASEEDGTVEFKYVYDDRIVVYIGIPEHITYKIQTAQTIITEKIDVNDGIMAGDLDVSMCYESKKSYFNEYTLLAPNAVPEHETTAPTDTTDTTESEDPQW